MNFKNLMLSFTLVSTAILGTGIAHATCSFSGEVVEVITGGQTGTHTVVYVKPASINAVPSYVFFFDTTNTDRAPALVGSLNHSVTIVGNAASCPTTGTYRYGGNVQWIYTS